MSCAFSCVRKKRPTVGSGAEERQAEKWPVSEQSQPQFFSYMQLKGLALGHCEHIDCTPDPFFGAGSNGGSIIILRHTLR